VCPTLPALAVVADAIRCVPCTDAITLAAKELACQP
jgi:hypothetical protein